MANTNKKFTSISDQTAQQIRNNANTLEILTKMDQALNSTESFINVSTKDSTGKQVNTQLITVGYFKQKLDQVVKMVKVMSGVDGNPAALQIANGQFKRIVVADLNLEPKPIPSISPVTTFKSDPNWIFDAFLNPKISVELDLTDKISDDTRTIQSKRFIVEFDRVITLDPNGTEIINYTTAGAARLQEFNDKYNGKTNIDMVEFATWLDTPGLVNRVDDTLIDQNFFRVEPNRLQFKGDFTISSTDVDTLNKKLWYILDTLTYYDISDTLNPPKPIQLKIGDYVNVNPNLKNVQSTTVYKVVEISTITSEFRVRFEQVYGEEPIPVRLNAISIYSDKIKNRTCKIGVGFDEHSVLFIRQVDDINNLIGLDWSPGVGFWTSDLRLDNANGELFSEYYITKVNDYGIVLEDLVAKKVPNYYGIKPNAPVLDVNNFKVVQVNAHLTQTVEAEQIRDLHNSKNNLTAEILQIQGSITKTNRLIQTTVFNSVADKKRSDDELALLNNKLNTKTQTKFSVVQDILANTKNLNKLNPIYHIRGFWPMPDAVQTSKTAPQEVVQFEVWYRKLSKSGAENPILTIPDINNSAAKTASELNTLTKTNISKTKTVNGSFSNWQKFKTDARKRSQDLDTGKWYWHIEDVSDASTPNINQIDIVIEPGEQIEIKIKSLSEVGWPETPVESDFSNIVPIVFPDDLNAVLNNDQFILSDAQSDKQISSLQSDLNARGLDAHLNSSITSGSIYYAHKANSIASGFTDANSNIINLYDQLALMVAKITSLEENVNRAKGILEVYLVNSANKIRLFNGNSLTYNINLEDYMVATKIGVTGYEVTSTARTYKNEIMRINDFSVLIKNNAATAPLGILSYRGYGQPGGLTPSTFAYDGKSVNDIAGSATTTTLNRGIQATWVSGDSTILQNNIVGNATPTTVLQAPQSATQQNNQWIWLQVKDLNGTYIYDSDPNQPANDFWLKAATSVQIHGESAIHNTLINSKYNLGFLAGTYGSTVNAGAGAFNSTTQINQIENIQNWEINEDPITVAAKTGRMGTTIHPSVSGFTNVVDTSTQLIKYIKSGDTDAILIPIYIYAKPYTGTGIYKNVGLESTKFDDTVISVAVGTLPPASGLIQKNMTTVAGHNNQLLIKINNINNLIKVGDKIVVAGIVTAGAAIINNLPMTVLVATTTYVITNANVSTISTADADITEAGLVLLQVHKKYTDSTTNEGPELSAYNVLGKVGADSRYINNYVEINATSSTPTPTVHTKKLRFYLEDESSPRPFDFQLTWNITQYKPVHTTTATININSINLRQ